MKEHTDTIGTIAGIIGMLCVVGLPITYAIVNRVLSHQERLEMLRRGIVPPPDPKWAKRMSRGGWDPGMYSAAGMAPPQQGCAPCPDYYGDPNRMLRKGITLVCVGIALTVGLSMINPGRLGPWLLGGLIPMFVGIAQVVIAMLSGAGGARSVMGPPPGSMPGPQQPFSGQQYQQPGAAPSGPFTGGWRPGPMTGLEKPPSPPDVR